MYIFFSGDSTVQDNNNGGPPQLGFKTGLKLLCKLIINFNRLSRRKRGVVSNPLFTIPDFFCIFPMNFAMATLGLKEMGKFVWYLRY